MALWSSSPLLIQHAVRPPTPSTIGLATPHSVVLPQRGIISTLSFQSLGHGAVMVDRSLHRPLFPGASLVPASSHFAAAATCAGDGMVTKKAIPVYMMLPLGVLDKKCDIVDPEGLINKLKLLKSIGVDGVMVDCWWGLVEAKPLEYNWTGYKKLFEIIRELKLKLQVVMSFHKCGGNVGDDITIPLPRWITEVGTKNPDIYFTDKHGNRNTECLSWGIDLERVLCGRTALEVYYDFMTHFRAEMDSFFEEGLISEIEVGLGPCGELRYPSYPMEFGWRFPGIGEFQCYDKYLMDNLKNAAREKGQLLWGHGPDDAGTYNDRPQDTEFFSDGGTYDSFYGRFFLGWYSNILIDHANRVLMLAKLAFHGSPIAAKISGIHWFYKTSSHAAELTAGFYNSCNKDGYTPITAMLKSHNVALNFTCVELLTSKQSDEYPEALCDPEALVWQVLNAGWDAGIHVASENALPCFDRDGFSRILKIARPSDDPHGRHLQSFTYLRLSHSLFEEESFAEFKLFVKGMHSDRFCMEESEEDLEG